MAFQIRMPVPPCCSVKDIMHIFQRDFENDFECEDVKENLQKILPKDELDDLFKLNRRDQVIRLFYLLDELTEQVVNQFFDDICDYDHLISPLRNERLKPNAQCTTYLEELDSLRNNNQRFAKYNVRRNKPYRNLQTALLQLRRDHNVLISGVLGAGKLWLALDVCSSYEVQRKMKFKIFWLNVQDFNTHGRKLELLKSFLQHLDVNGHNNRELNINSIDTLKSLIRNLLKKDIYMESLLVLYNVEDIESWKTFNLNCKILIITRFNIFNHFSSKTTEHIFLKDKLKPDETTLFFKRYLGNVHKKVPLRMFTNTNPRLLSIIAENIRDNHLTWNNWNTIKHDKLTNIIEKSLKLLNPAYRKMFDKLFIFPRAACIPTDLLEIVWSLSNQQSLMTIINELHMYSLVEKIINKSGVTISVVPLVRIYFEPSVSNKDEIDLHQKIVDSFSIDSIFDYPSITPKPDTYFYRNIGYHLSKLKNSGSLFRKIYLDFRFLENLIRLSTTPLNTKGSVFYTLQQLKIYESYIVENDNRQQGLLTALLDFLPKVEEKLIRSQYTSLLQAALMTQEGLIFEEAYRQIQKFPEHVWFTEHGLFHQYRQLLNLGKHCVRDACYLDNDFCLIALDNQHLLLTDISLEAETTYHLYDKDDPSEIIHMHVFNKQNHLLTLHTNGSLKLWTLTVNCNRQMQYRHNNFSWQNMHPLHTHNINEHSPKQCHKQLVNEAVKHPHKKTEDQRVTAFYVDENAEMPHTSIQLHVALVNGDIVICDWENEEFRLSKTPRLETQQIRISCLVKVVRRFYVLSTTNCSLTVWDLRNSAQCLSLDEKLAITEPVLTMNLYTERLSNGQQFTTLLLIYAASVKRLRFKSAHLYENLLPISETIYVSDCEITCAKSSSDGCYLIIGTKSEGVLVLDLKKCEPILRSNISEHIAYVDIYGLMDARFHYIVLCGAVGSHLLYVHSICQNQNSDDLDRIPITWLHKITNVRGNNDISLNVKPIDYLRPVMDMSNSGIHIFVADSKHRIHPIETNITRSNNKIISFSPTYSESTVTALSVYDDNQIFVGYKDGVVIDAITDSATLQKLCGPIDYLKQINKQILVASSSRVHETIIFKLPVAIDGGPMKNNYISHWPLKLQIDTVCARRFGKKFLILFHLQGVCYLNISNLSNEHPREIDGSADHLVGFDLQNQRLFLALGDNLKIYQLEESSGNLNYRQLCTERFDHNSNINFLRASLDGDVVALGLCNGHIVLYAYDAHHLELIHTISDGHYQAIRQLRFSPCKQVLVSCAESLCFWSVSGICQLKKTPPEGHSRRFNSNNQEQVDALPYKNSLPFLVRPREVMNISLKKNVLSSTDSWQNKRSNNLSKPELLACIPFVAKQTRKFFVNPDFTQFYFVDDEGIYYHLRLLQQSAESKAQSIIPSISIVQYGNNDGVSQRILKSSSIDGDVDDGYDVVGSILQSTNSLNITKNEKIKSLSKQNTNS